MPAWARLQGGRLRITLKVAPGSSRDDVAIIDAEPDGRASLHVRVTRMAQQGKANEAVVKLLAKRWKIAPGRFAIIKGATSRQKVIDIAPADQALIDRIRLIENKRNS